MNTIILITNLDEIKQKIQDNLVLLRSTDKLLAVNYDNAPDVLFEKRPDIIIIHENENRDKTFGIIKYLKEKRIFQNTNIILLVNEYDRNFILSAYDEGIDDYLIASAEPSEILIRVINSIKKSDLKTKVRSLSMSLEAYGILDINTGFYNQKYEADVFNVLLSNAKSKLYSYMIISLDEQGKKEIQGERIIRAIKKSVRSCDFVSMYSASKFGLLLQTNVDGAVEVYRKIKSELDNNPSVKAGIATYDGKKFEEIKKKASSSLNNALLKDVEYVVYSSEDNVQDDWLQEPVKSDKTYKFFKKAFSNKIENVIAPIFYRVQKTYEEKIGDAKIEQFTDEEQSVFRIILGQRESRLTMMYPGYSKLVVYITHSGFDSPENREIIVPLNMVSQEKIDEILEGFINEFIGIYRHIYTE